MPKSVERMDTVVWSFGLELSIRHMPRSTFTAVEAAEAVGCSIGQIVKSLMFETDTGKLALLLVSGRRTVVVKKFVLD